MGRRLTKTDFMCGPVELAQKVIGATLLLNGVGGVIVEAEAYDESEPGSHCHGGVTPRNVAMFGPPGHAYVYINYGIHFCMNFVCGKKGHGCGVLIRALQPTRKVKLMKERRGMENERLLCAGPGRVGQALAITMDHYGLPLYFRPFQVFAPDNPSQIHVLSGPRIGVKKAPDLMWRFGLEGSRYLSHTFASAAKKGSHDAAADQAS